MTIQRLVHMANQVADFFGSYPEAEAIDSTANHLKSFWDPRMRHEFLALLDQDEGRAVNALVREALQKHRAMVA